MRRTTAALLMLTLAMLSPRPAEANGRFPYSNELLLHPNDHGMVVVRTTFGLITARDRKTFHWTCEPIIGFDPGLDPGVAVFEDGSIATGSYHGLAVTHDGACSFPFIQGDLANQYVIDLTVEPATPSRALALTATPITGERSFVQVFETADNGRTWSKAGAPLAEDIIATTIEVAPSRRERIYVAGSFVTDGLRSAFIQASDDRGATWGPRTVVEGTTTLYVAAVDPFDPDRVYARTYKAAAQDSLLVSTDGAKTFETALTIKDRVNAFALSPDGSRIAAGGAFDGIFVGGRADAGTDYAFTKTSDLPIECLRWGADALYACGLTNRGAPFVVGASTDEGRTFVPLLAKLQDIAGPPPCPRGTPSQDQCTALWPAQRERFSNPTGLVSDAGADASADAGRDAEPPPRRDDECRLGGGAQIPVIGFATVVIIGLMRRRSRTPRR